MSADNSSSSSAIVAFDIGGTRIKAGIVRDASVSSFTTVAMDECRVMGGPLACVIQLGRRLIENCPVSAVGISMRGIVDPRSGVLLDVNPPLTELIDQPLAAIIAEALGCPAYIENDARMYALGELVHGAGGGYQNLVCLTLGTGIGCGVALEGRVLRGSRGVGGILGGHITVQADGPLCSCGNRGCLETFIGTRALKQAIEQALATDRPSLLRDGPADPRHLFAAAAMGDDLALEIVRCFTTLLGAGIVSMIHTYDPDIVIIGGGIAAASTQFLPDVQRYVDTHAWTLPRKRVRVSPALLGDNAALIGITALVKGAALLQ